MLLFYFSDVQHLATYGLEGPSQEETKPKFGDWSGVSSLKVLGGTGVRAPKAQVPVLSVTPVYGKVLPLKSVKLEQKWVQIEGLKIM